LEKRLSSVRPIDQINEKEKKEIITLTENIQKEKSSSKLEKAIATATGIYYSQNYEETIRENQNILINYYEVLSRDQLESIYIQIALSFHMLEKYDEAIEYYSKGIIIKANNSFSYNNRANAYTMKEDYDKAMVDYNKALEIDPNNFYALNGRGIFFRRLKEYEKAQEDFNTVIKLMPNYSDAYFNRGFVYELNNEYMEAIADYNKAIELKPNSYKTLLNRTELLLCLNKIKEAESQIKILNKFDLKGSDKLGREFIKIVLSVLNNSNKKTSEECFEELKIILSNDIKILRWSFNELSQSLKSKNHESTSSDKKQFIFDLIDKIEKWCTDNKLKRDYN
jgi:tetratricopeptide (TPR) repeat protein